MTLQVHNLLNYIKHKTKQETKILLATRLKVVQFRMRL